MRDHEVEVPPYERGAKDFPLFLGEGPGVRSENRIDQRMPLKFVTNFLLPSKESARSNEFKKTLSPARKPDSNDWDKGNAGDNRLAGFCLFWVVEGLFCLIAKSFNRHARACLFCFDIVIARAEMRQHRSPKQSPISRGDCFALLAMTIKQQESGRQNRTLFIE